MFDHEKMSEKDQERYAAEMSAAIQAEKQAGTDFPPNCGAPLNPEGVNAGQTWDSEARKWVTHQSLGATLSNPQKGWQGLFSEFNERYAYPRRLKVVSIVYDWKVFN